MQLTYANSAVPVVGVLGEATGTVGERIRQGVSGRSSGGDRFYGVYGTSSGGTSFNAAGYFDGNVYANGVLLTSDRKLKKEIAPVENSLDQLMKLKPSVYQFKTDEYRGMQLSTGKQVGLIADEVKNVFPELVQKAYHPALYDEKDRSKVLSPEVEYEAVNYMGLTPVMVACIQELKKENNQQQQQIAELKKELSELKQLIGKLANGQPGTGSSSSGGLLQNAPNPVGGTTTIQYSLPEGSSRGQLLLTDAAGRTVKAIQLTSAGRVSVDVSSLSNGVYNYSLVVGGRTVQTKKMTVER